MANVRSRYEALGSERGFFGVAAVATALGAILPVIRTPEMFFSLGSGLRFYNLGLAGWFFFIVIVLLAVFPFVQPVATVGRRARACFGVAMALIGMLTGLLAVGSYGFFEMQPGSFSWLIAAVSLAAGYWKRL